MVAARGSDRRVIPAVRPLNPIFHPASAGSGLEGPRLHPLERALVAITALHLCFLPWALGTMHVWSQLASLGLSAVGFGLALLPRADNDAFSSSTGPTEWPAARLRRFPIFWASLAWLAYVAVQGFNPAWHYLTENNDWWLEPVSHLAWLPSGVDAPFEQSNPWRLFVVFASLGLLVCSVWTGFLRRQSYRILFVVLAVNAGLLGLLGLLQRLGNADQILWSCPSSNASFIASFIYPNHAGPYFNLMVALAVGLAWWQHERTRRRLARPAPARLLAALAAFTGLLVIFSYSRMSITLLLGFMVLTGGILAVRLGGNKGPVPGRAEFFPLILVLAGLTSFCVVSVNTEKVWERFSGFMADPAAAARDRTLTRRAATDMLHDRWLFGWGAGGFRYGFTKYAKRYPEIGQSADGRRRYWEHAHNDLLEFPVELGLAGMLPLAGMLGYGAWQLGRRRFWRNPVSLCLVLGCGLVMVHAWVDFVFQCPAVLLTWSVLLTGAVRWLELDQTGVRPRVAKAP